ncbi:MAG: hypothetical protein WEA77_06730 [Hyphomonas sp.]|uniref:hypothetical protein n=1 Tax=Hyphomonas sp. TaxID=87 RepID=UPI0034A043B9
MHRRTLADARRLALTLALTLASAGLLAACACFPDRAPAYGAPTAAQAGSFGALTGLVGKTWRSEPVAEGETGPADISAWSWDLGGRVMVNRHALEDRSYGGVTYVYENGQTGSLDYVYVTSAGFHTTGTFVLGDDGSWTAEEAVTGHDTITRVRSTGRLTPEGTMTMTSEYFAKGEWSPGRNVVYASVDADIPKITGRLAE